MTITKTGYVYRAKSIKVNFNGIKHGKKGKYRVEDFVISLSSYNLDNGKLIAKLEDVDIIFANSFTINELINDSFYQNGSLLMSDEQRTYINDTGLVEFLTSDAISDAINETVREAFEKDDSLLKHGIGFEKGFPVEIFLTDILKGSGRKVKAARIDDNIYIKSTDNKQVSFLDISVENFNKISELGLKERDIDIFVLQAIDSKLYGVHRGGVWAFNKKSFVI